jgi:hypothetical protein
MKLQAPMPTATTTAPRQLDSLEKRINTEMRRRDAPGSPRPRHPVPATCHERRREGERAYVQSVLREQREAPAQVALKPVRRC